MVSPRIITAHVFRSFPNGMALANHLILHEPKFLIFHVNIEYPKFLLFSLSYFFLKQVVTLWGLEIPIKMCTQVYLIVDKPLLRLLLQISRKSSLLTSMRPKITRNKKRWNVRRCVKLKCGQKKKTYVKNCMHKRKRQKPPYITNMISHGLSSYQNSIKPFVVHSIRYYYEFFWWTKCYFPKEFLGPAILSLISAAMTIKSTVK